MNQTMADLTFARVAELFYTCPLRYQWHTFLCSQWPSNNIVSLETGTILLWVSSFSCLCYGLVALACSSFASKPFVLLKQGQSLVLVFWFFFWKRVKFSLWFGRSVGQGSSTVVQWFSEKVATDCKILSLRLWINPKGNPVSLEISAPVWRLPHSLRCF